MTRFLVAKWPNERFPVVCNAALLHEARELARTWAVVAAFSKAHALRLFAEQAEAVRGCDGRLDAPGIVERGGVP